MLKTKKKHKKKTHCINKQGCKVAAVGVELPFPPRTLTLV